MGTTGNLVVLPSNTINDAARDKRTSRTMVKQVSRAAEKANTLNNRELNSLLAQLRQTIYTNDYLSNNYGYAPYLKSDIDRFKKAYTILDGEQRTRTQEFAKSIQAARDNAKRKETLGKIGTAIGGFVNSVQDKWQQYDTARREQNYQNLKSLIGQIGEGIGTGVENVSKFLGNLRSNAQGQDSSTQAPEGNNVEESTDDIVEYTYKPGDTFGQVLLDLGLSQPGGLWGDNGDVAYYTQQLRDQGLWGNIPIGTTIKLRRRK